MTIAVKSKHKVESAAPSQAGDVARLVIDDAGLIRQASPAFAALAGASPELLRGTPLADIMTFVDADAAVEAQTEGGLYDVTIRGRRVALHFDVIAAADGRQFMAAAPVSAAAPDFWAAESELRHFLAMSDDLMAVCAADGSFLRASPSFFSVLGYDPAQIEKMIFPDIVHTDDRAHVRGCLYSIARDEADDTPVVDFETRVMTRTGRTLWTEWRLRRNGGLVYSVGRDVTEIKEHEFALRQQQEQLAEAQAIGHMGHWRWTVGSDDLEMSDEIYRIFGVTRGVFVPTLDNFNAMLHRRDVGRMLQAFQRAIIGHNNYDMEFCITRPDGGTRVIRCEGRCQLDDGDEVVALFGIMQDITERTLHERDLRAAKDAAERAYAAKSQFLANMSHELRTPLNAIIGFSEMMQRQLLGPIGTEKYLDYIAGIRESGEHLLDLISDILDMSKIEAGKYELDLEELQIGKVVRLAAHMMEGRAQEARITLGIDVEDENAIIVADRRAVMQILLNLLSNAVKFTDPNGSVRIECVCRDDGVTIRVRDTGIGIPAHKIGCVMRPFEQAASHYTREHEGTGLGLAITKELTEMHGGALHIESTVGVGTTVTVKLPRDAYPHVKAAKDKAAK